MNAKIFSEQLYSSLNGDSNAKVFWDYISLENTFYYDSATLDSIRAGRTGFSFVMIGVYLIFTTKHHFIGK